MALSALKEDLTLLTPYLLIQDGFHRSNVQRDSRTLAKNNQLYCPHCYASYGELRNVLFRSGGDAKRDHFFHSKSDVICTYSPMTEKHINAQSWIANHLSKKFPDALVQKEMQLRQSKEDLCRPDICVILPDGTKFAYEIQISKITEHEVKTRTEKLQNNGCKAVTWFFTELSDSLLIQECLALKKQHHALIYFEEDSAVGSISVTDLKTVRQSLLAKLWHDYCLRESKCMTIKEFTVLTANSIFNIDIQLFFDVLTIKEFNLKAKKIYSKIIDDYRSQERIEQIKKSAKRKIATPSNKILFNPKVAAAECIIFFLEHEIAYQESAMKVWRVLAKKQKNIRITTPSNKRLFIPQIALAECLIFFLSQTQEIKELKQKELRAENPLECNIDMFLRLCGAA